MRSYIAKADQLVVRVEEERGMSRLTVVEAAEALAHARANRKPIPAIRMGLASMDIDAAYAIQKRNVDAALAAGAKRVGRKIGLTSIAVQRQLEVDQPDFGSLLDDMWISEGAMISAASLIAPRIEGEIAFRIGADMAEIGPDTMKLALKIDSVAAAFEIVDSAIANWDINIVDTVADNASCGVFVIGQAVRYPSPDDLATRAMRLTLDGVPISEGSDAATLGHPLNALKWLASVSIERGDPLRAGEWVLAGALGPMKPMTPGAYALEIDGFERLSVTVTV